MNVDSFFVVTDPQQQVEILNREIAIRESVRDELNGQLRTVDSELEQITERRNALLRQLNPEQTTDEVIEG